MNDKERQEFKRLQLVEIELHNTVAHLESVVKKKDFEIKRLKKMIPCEDEE